jgi:hypothetical protein
MQAIFTVWGLFTFMTTPLEAGALTYVAGARARWQKQATSALVRAWGRGFVRGRCGAKKTLRADFQAKMGRFGGA